MKKQKAEEARTWCQLPTDIVWMIKDQLTSFRDQVFLAAVCKAWKAASESYSLITPKNRVAPWLYQRYFKSTITSTKGSEFVNVATNEKLILDVPELLKSKILYSKQGWLLLDETGRLHTAPFASTPIILLNLHTDEKITLPDSEERLQKFTAAAFSCSKDGKPEYVVFDVSSPKGKTFYIITVGDDEKWTEYSYENGRRMHGTRNLIVRNNKIFFLEFNGCLLIYNMASLLWTEVGVNDRGSRMLESVKSWITESEEGGMLKIQKRGNQNYFEFFKLNDRETDWEELGLCDLQNRSWFTSVATNNPFTVKETAAGEKVYNLHGRQQSTQFPPYGIDIHDSIDNSRKSYEVHKKPDILLWVDLGVMFKMPPSCVGYICPTWSRV